MITYGRLTVSLDKGEEAHVSVIVRVANSEESMFRIHVGEGATLTVFGEPEQISAAVRALADEAVRALADGGGSKK